jgi:hypothetical protein
VGQVQNQVFRVDSVQRQTFGNVRIQHLDVDYRDLMLEFFVVVR